MAFDEAIIINAVLAGTRAYLLNAQQIAAANEEIGLSTDRAGMAMERTTRRGYLMNQALFTVRRLMYGMTIATIASGVAAVKWGWDFNNAMQQARVALSPLQSGIFDVNKELDYLFNFTKYTPFQFKDITTAFRQMYGAMHPLGISAQDVNGYIKAMVDALSFAGRTTPGALNRVAVALQHVAFQGHLTGQAVTQLARDGLPIYAALRKELGLTSDQMHSVGALGIPTQVAMKALHDYIESTPGFMNAAHRQAVNTFHGLFTTFRDNLSQLMGAVETGWFKRMQGFLMRVNSFFDNISGQLKHHASLEALFSSINTQLTPGSNAVIMFWHQFSGAVHEAWVLFTRFVSTITHSQTIWAMLYIGLAAVHGALWFVNHNGWLVIGMVEYLLPLWIAFHVYTKLNAIWLGILAFETAGTTKAFRELTFAQALYRVWTDRDIIATKLFVFWQSAMNVLMYRARILLATYTIALEISTGVLAALSAAFLEARLAAATFFATLYLGMGPLGWLLLAITAIIAGIVILYFRWGRFHDLVNNTARGMYEAVTHPWRTVITFIHQATQAAREFFGLRSTKPGSGRGILPFGLSEHAGLGFHNPFRGLASGGTVVSGGLTWVGERGPELLSLPAGASVVPLSQVGALGGLGQQRQGPLQPIIIQLLLKERVLAEAVANVQLDRAARA